MAVLDEKTLGYLDEERLSRRLVTPVYEFSDGLVILPMFINYLTKCHFREKEKKISPKNQHSEGIKGYIDRGG